MLFFINFILAYEYYIKLYKKELYLKGEKFPGARPTLDTYEKKNTFKLEKLGGSNNEKIVYVKEHPNYVLNIEGTKTKLIYFSVTKHINERFKMIPLDMISVYYLQTLGKCLTYDEKENHLSIMECKKSNPNQMFEFICSNCSRITIEKILTIPKEPSLKNESKKPCLTNELIHIIRDINYYASKASDFYIKNEALKSYVNINSKAYCCNTCSTPSKSSPAVSDLRIENLYIGNIPTEKFNEKNSDMRCMKNISENKRSQSNTLFDFFNEPKKNNGTLKNIKKENYDEIKKERC